MDSNKTYQLLVLAGLFTLLCIAACKKENPGPGPDYCKIKVHHYENQVVFRSFPDSLEVDDVITLRRVNDGPWSIDSAVCSGGITLIIESIGPLVITETEYCCGTVIEVGH